MMMRMVLLSDNFVEVCDGQFNDCSNNYVENSAPVDELDDDGDGWIECRRDIDVVLNSLMTLLIYAQDYGAGGTCLAPALLCAVRHLNPVIVR